MLPFYTSVLSTEDYGTADLIATTVNLLLPVLTLAICEAVLRFAMEREEDYSQIFMIGLKITVIGSIILLLGIPIALYMGILSLYVLFYLTYIVTVGYTLLSQFARGRGYVKTFAISGVISTAVVVSCNILFLVVFRWGITGYLLSTILAYLVCIVYISVSIHVWQFIDIKKKIQKEKYKEMLKYSAPLIPNTITWWVNLSLDRYLLTAMSGIGSNGIYSVANKLPTIFSTFSDIFIRAWQLSAVSEYDAEDRNLYYKQIYKYYNVFLVLSCSVAIIVTRFLAKILFADEFFVAWKSAPFLMISAVFSAFNGFIGSVYTASKNTKVLFYSTLVGAISNIILNIVLIPGLDEVGAAIATCFSFSIIWLIRCLTMPKEFRNIGFLEHKYLVSYVLLFVQGGVLLIYGKNSYIFMILIFVIFMILYNKDIVVLLKQMQKKIFRR